MALVARKRKTGVVYYVANKLGKRPIFERVGPDKREAQRRDAAMKKEIKAGAYHGKATGGKTIGGYAEPYLVLRATRTAEEDRRHYRTIQTRCPKFLEIKLEDVRKHHVVELAKVLKTPYVNAKGKLRTLAPRSHANIFKSFLGPMFAECRLKELMLRNVMEKLPKGTLDGSSIEREPYDASTVTAMTCDPRLPPHWRMLFTLLFYTGCRIGEVCGLTWVDWDPGPKPLGSLTVEKQYDHKPMKTGTRVGDRKATRHVPVHPVLAAALREWRETGFEMVYCRKPLGSDFIVPRKNGKNQTKHSTYEWFREALRRLGIKNQTMHATRNTFISLARRAGARKDVLERVTHRGSKEEKLSQIDRYTQFDWVPLCEAVSYFMAQPPAERAPLLYAV